MNRKLTLSFVIYAVCAIVMIAIGLSFELRNEFMPFHSDVIQTEWQSVEAKSQILYLGMMRTEGAGFLATATALLFLLYFPFRKFEKWSYWAMTVIGVVECLPSFLANYYVSTVTSASPPWWLMLALMLSLTLALVLATMGSNEKLQKDALT
ncbi:MAG: hypothetical protein AB8B86_18090 [Pseudomonadales bacterium]